ncbi:hypothetical protein C482_04706 [Natrialba chahannaoensis JCM 10990]|uniref:Uncharacterized protein n=1 Tax=Natrialba chahannaoensis JCM 10990 TaxID=1227492 RepID=M0AWP2_9EURY|nr:hypothetical protein [Natrialba chahannaoensis]ELZ02930.1 hypothetical protein C482_04706 [Natrialba chahannaoensis JCM 10990]
MGSPPRSLSRFGRSAPVSRREFVAAVGGAGGASLFGPSADASESEPDHLRVRVYPGPVPPTAWLWYGVEGMSDDWPTPFQDAFAAVEDAMDQIQAYAADRSLISDSTSVSEPELTVRVERGPPVRFPLLSVSQPTDLAFPSLSAVLDAFRDQLHDRGALGGPTCHLLLCWSPFNYQVGYGGTISPNDLIDSAGSDADDPDAVAGAQTVANIGATEVWDSRAVSRNIAIHEVLHTFLSPDIVADVGDTRCDHNLGTATRTGLEGRTLQVSPMATAYAGPDEFGGGTRFHGTGCYDHDEFARHDGYEVNDTEPAVDRFEYTTELSEATLEAATRYLIRLTT